MIIFLGNGRLGNQLFQYAFLKSIQSQKELVLTAGLEEIDKYFSGFSAYNLDRSVRFYRILSYEIGKRILDFMGKLQLITVIKVIEEEVNGVRRETTNYETIAGLLSWIKYVKTGFFQSYHFLIPSRINSLKIKSALLEKAQEFLSTIPKKSYLIVVHVRRGDYRDFSIAGKSTSIPVSYYLNSINWFIKNKQNPYFVFLSDEPESIENDFKQIKNKIISKSSNPGVDMAIISLCASAILSPSSFSWWGSYFMKNRDIIFAPKYWLGAKLGIEYQSGGTPKYAKVVNI